MPAKLLIVAMLLAGLAPATARSAPPPNPDAQPRKQAVAPASTGNAASGQKRSHSPGAVKPGGQTAAATSIGQQKPSSPTPPVTASAASRKAVAKATAAPAAATDDAAGADSTDATGIEEQVTQSSRELQEMQQAEDQALSATVGGPRGVHLLGVANPLRLRAADPFGRETAGETPAALPQLGDAGEVLQELSGIDLATLKRQYDIPVEVNDDVIACIRFFQTGGRKWFTKWLERSHVWIPVERPILAQEGVPLDLVYLSMIESGFSEYAYSWASASGLWQFVRGTGRLYGVRDDFWVDERRDPVKATRAAAQYLKSLHDQFGDWYLAWAAYNAGAGRIQAAINRYGTRDFWQLAHDGRALRPETKQYVPKLIAAALIAKHPKRFGFADPVVPSAPYRYDEVEVPDATDLAVVARAAGVSTAAVQRLNPALRRWCTPPRRAGHGYLVKLPFGTKVRFLAEFAKIKPSQRLTFRHHRIHRGDTLGAIARAFRTPLFAIERLNHIRNPRRLRLGQEIIIPLPTQLAKYYPDRPDRFQARRRVRPGWQRHARRWRRRSARVAWRGRNRSRRVARGRYVVRAGDTVWSIAQKFGVAVGELRRWNRLSWRAMHRLQVGRMLVVAPRNRRRAARETGEEGG